MKRVVIAVLAIGALTSPFFGRVGGAAAAKAQDVKADQAPTMLPNGRPAASSVTTASGMRAEVIRLAGTCTVVVTRVESRPGDPIAIVPCGE